MIVAFKRGGGDFRKAVGLEGRRGMRGLGVDPSINATTFWTPRTGYLAEPGNVASAVGSGPAVYQAPTMIAAPACTQANGGAFVSSGCVDLALHVEAQNQQVANNANFDVFYRNCVAGGTSPAECASRSYGLTPVGGYTSNAGPQRAPEIMDRYGNVVTNVPVYADPARAVAPVFQTSTPTVVNTQAPRTAPATSGGGSAQHYVDQATEFISGDVEVAGHEFPIWALAAAGVVALFAFGGRR